LSGAPAVSILIVAYESAAHLPGLMDALDAQTFQDFEIILIDNASTAPPDEAVVARARARGAHVANPTNAGFAAANNQGARQAAGTWLALLNPDATPAPDWLERLMAATRAHPGVEAFGSTQILAEDAALLDGAGDVYHAAGIPYRGGHRRPPPPVLRDGEPFTPCAAAALWRADRFRALGGFEEDFFCYCEDVDLGFRHRLAGGRALQVADARVTHVGGASSGRASDFAVFHGTRNRLWTFVRCMPGPLLVAMALPHAGATLLLWLHASLRGIGAPYGRGLAAALSGLGAAWRARKAIQKTRRVGLMALARQMAWSPWALATRGIVLRAPPET
jgi:GT2 family glycosyltransferase